jgi:undecaprenyl pyrophosphate synthase
MKTIIDKITGKVLFATADDKYEVLANEMALDEMVIDDFGKGYYNFETEKFYEGATAQEIAELKKESVPQEVQLWRIRVILKLSSLESAIEAVLNNLEEPTKTAANYIWNYGSTVERNSQTVALLQTALQLTNEQVDEMFIEANNIKL